MTINERAAITTAVVGAGRMGSVVARQLPPGTRKVIIDLDPDKARQLAQAVGGTASETLEGAREADLVAIVLPAPAVNGTVDKLLDVVKKGAVIINMATTASVDPEIIKKNKDVFVVDTKIIGHAMSISGGEAGIIIAKTDNQRVFALIKNQLAGFTYVVQGDADLVPIINTIAATEGIKAAVAVRRQLREMNVPEEWIKVAIRTVCAGTMKSFAENDLGNFGLELVKKLGRLDD